MSLLTAGLLITTITRVHKSRHKKRARNAGPSSIYLSLAVASLSKYYLTLRFRPEVVKYLGFKLSKLYWFGSPSLASAVAK